jgi:hypothetical protein
MVLTVNRPIFLDVKPCSLVEVYWCFRRICCLHFQDQKVSQASDQKVVSRPLFAASLAYSLTPKMEAIYSSETSVNLYWPTAAGASTLQESQYSNGLQAGWLRNRGLIPSRGSRFFRLNTVQTCSTTHPAHPVGSRTSFLRGVKLIIHLHLMQRSWMVQLYLHYPIYITGLALNLLSTRETLPLFLP